MARSRASARSRKIVGLHEEEPSTAHARWQPSTMDPGRFRQRFGSSIVEQFVAGHDAMDVLRELVQNEFDAGGSKMSVDFGATGLTIVGTGKPIDARGWARLDVILGTGAIVGDGSSDVVQAKQNGIGSKNLGLRSLLRFGDRIHVRSNGRMSVLDLNLGTLLAADPSSEGTKGVSIHVPYRSIDVGALPAFDVERERHALGLMAAGLFDTLAKLAVAGRGAGIRALVVSSKRTGRTLEWTQGARVVPCGLKGVTATIRSGRLRDRDDSSGGETSSSFEEIEFAHAVAVPDEYAGHQFPEYYRAPRRKVVIGVSLPLRRRRPDPIRSGHFYYPLKAPNGLTGSSVSVNAPFELDSDRSALLPSDWNSWLSRTAADLATDLVSSDWIDRFGPEGLLSVRQIGATADSDFATNIELGLKEKACWPSAARGVPKKASDLVVPDDVALGGFLSSERYLDPRLAAEDDVRDFCIKHGASRFSLNSLVRLRCAPVDKAVLATKIAAGEADYHFTEYAAALSKPEVHARMGDALHKLRRHLSNPNRKDLKDTPSTLAADGKLAPASSLVIVDADIWDECPEPPETRLHQDLTDNKFISSLARPFRSGDWIVDAATRAASGTIGQLEREALYRHLLRPGTKLSRDAVALLRTSPVVKSDAGVWTAPEDLALLPREVAGQFIGIVAAPDTVFSRRKDLVRRFRIRTKLVAADLVALARGVGGNATMAQRCEGLLLKYHRLITPKVATELAQVDFLRSKGGTIEAPTKLHLDNAINNATLDSETAIVAGSNISLYRMLGCKESPSAQTLLAALEGLRVASRPPSRPDVFYPALIAAAKSSKTSLVAYLQEPILWLNGQYRRPADVLVGATVPRFLDTVLPVLRGVGLLERAFEDLGAVRVPLDRHWAAFFRSFNQPAASNGQPTSGDRRLLHAAYQRLSLQGLPAELEENNLCLLGRDGRLYSRESIKGGLLVEDDFPELAKALASVGTKIAFADLSEDAGPFFFRLGLKRLSDVCGDPTTIALGDVAAPPQWLKSSRESSILELIHKPQFAAALQELAWARRRGFERFDPVRASTIGARLGSITAITFASSIATTYSVASETATVQADWALLPDRIALTRTRSLFEYMQTIAHVLAHAIGATNLADNRAMANSISPLLSCSGSLDMLHYLRQQGIRLSQTQVQEFEDDDVAEPEELPKQADDGSETAAQIVNQLVESLNLGHSADHASNLPPTPPNPAPPPAAPVTTPVFSLPPLDKVALRVEEASGEAPPKGPGGGGGGWSSYWTAPTAADDARDRLVGARGEELVYRHEIERLRAVGHSDPEAVVVWTSRHAPGADHDIMSIAPDGQQLWIEVKSTTGSDGRFEWSRAEFERACSEGDHYELWRVYQAQSEAPVAKAFRDPVAMFSGNGIRLELGTIRAYLEGAES